MKSYSGFEKRPYKLPLETFISLGGHLYLHSIIVFIERNLDSIGNKTIMQKVSKYEYSSGLLEREKKKSFRSVLCL